MLVPPEGSKKARLSVMIKSGLTYERLLKFQDKYCCMMVLKVKIAKNLNLHTLCVYIQRKMLKEMNQPSSKSLPQQLDSILKAIKQLSTVGKQLVIMGDLND